MAEEAKVKKVEEFLARGISPYPYSYKRTSMASEIASNFSRNEGRNASIAGRIIRLRKMGKIIFMDLLDESGKLQVIFREDVVDKQSAEVLHLIDIGDILGAEGKIIKSESGKAYCCLAL